MTTPRRTHGQARVDNDRATLAEGLWDEETIEAWLPDRRLVFVFRYVPTYATV